MKRLSRIVAVVAISLATVICAAQANSGAGPQGQRKSSQQAVAPANNPASQDAANLRDLSNTLDDLCFTLCVFIDLLTLPVEV